jgi:hypothetical protein
MFLEIFMGTVSRSRVLIEQLPNSGVFTMMKHVLSGAMALGLIASAAYAQDTSVNRQTTVTTAPDGDRVVRNKTTVNRDGYYGDSSVTRNTVRRTDSWDGDTSTTSRTTRRTDTPYGDTSSTTVRRTNTDR